MVKLNKILDFLCDFAPLEYAEDYDNVGLILGDKYKQVEKILVTLDIDNVVADHAVLKECDLVISHHPLIFSPIKKIVSDDSTSKTIITLLKNNVSLISMHTNFDSVESGLCDLFMDKIAQTKDRISIDKEIQSGCGRIALLDKETKLLNILDTVKKEYKLDNIKYIGEKDKKIEKIAVCNGGGADFIYKAKEMGADLYISGDFKYHHARFAYENDMALIEVPHYNAEIIFCDYMKGILKDKFGNNLQIFVTDKNIDVWKSI